MRLAVPRAALQSSQLGSGGATGAPAFSALAIGCHSQNVGMNAHHARPAMQGAVPAAAA